MSGHSKSDQEKQQAERDAAKLLLTRVKELTESVPALVDRIKTLEKGSERFKDIDPSNVLKNIDELKTGLEGIQKRIASNENAGLYIPGLYEDNQSKSAGKKFSILRACIGVKLGGTEKAFEKAEASYEWEIMKQVRAKAEAAGQVVGVDSQGGFFVPDQVIPDVIQAIYTRSVLIDLAGDGQTRVSVLDGLVGQPVKIPKFNGGVIAYWIGEQDDYVLAKAKVGNVTMTPRKLGVLTKITNEMRRFQTFGFENLLRVDMIRAIAKEADRVVLYGAGTDDEPRGVTQLDGISVYRTEDGRIFDRNAPEIAADDWQGGAMDFDDLDEMQGHLEDNDLDIDTSYAYISAPRFWRRLRQLKVSNFATQTDEKPYLLGSPMIRDETMRALIGDFDKTTQVPTKNLPGASINANTTSADEKHGDVFGANWNEILVGRWSGIEIEDDEGKGEGFIRDETFVKMRLFMDVGHRQERGVIMSPDVQMRD